SSAPARTQWRTASCIISGRPAENALWAIDRKRQSDRGAPARCAPILFPRTPVLLLPVSRIEISFSKRARGAEDLGQQDASAQLRIVVQDAGKEVIASPPG